MKQWGRAVIAAALTTSGFWSSHVAADGQPVAGFGVNGVMIDGSFTSGRQVRTEEVVELPGGDLVVSGFLQESGQPTVQQFMARYSSTGQLDPNFGAGGVTFPTGVVRDLTTLPDGQLVVTAFSALGGLGMIGADGSMAPLPVRLFPGQLIRRPDGAIFALGGGEPGTRVASLIRPDGALDAGFEADIAAVLPPGARMGAMNVVYSPPNGTLLSDGRLAVAFAYTTAAPSQAVCGIVALQENGRYDPAFGSGGLLSISQTVCRVDHFADDSIRVAGDFGEPVLAFSSTGVPLGALSAPFDAEDLAFEGTGRLFAKTGPNQITAFDPLGNADPTYGANGVATLPGMTITDFALLDSGDIVAWGNPVGNETALALGLIEGEHGTALQPPAIPITKFVPVAPTRILDTREGVGAPAGAVGAGGRIDLQIAGVAGVAAAGVAAVVLNVTATEAAQAGYVSVHPAGTRRPPVSNVNLESPGQTASNLVTVKVGSNGKVSLFTSGGAHLVADITGYYTPAVTATDGRLQSATPQRILDTREGLGAPRAKLQAGGQVELQVAGRGPVPADGVTAVVLNVTGDRAIADGHVTVWPTGLERPVVSNLNLLAGETRANLVVVPIGAGGSVSLFTSGGADLIADVAGWFTDASAPSASAGLFVPITPTRILDTRQEPTAPAAPLSSLIRAIGSTGTVPPDAALAVAANITVTESGGPGFLTAWPAGTSRPLASNLNTVRAAQTVPNAAIVPLGADDIAVYTQSGAQLIIDINGWYTND